MSTDLIKQLKECTETTLRLKEVIQEFPTRCAQQSRDYYSKMHTAWDFVMTSIVVLVLAIAYWNRYNRQLKEYWRSFLHLFEDKTQLPHDKQQSMPIQPTAPPCCAHSHEQHSHEQHQNTEEVHEELRQRFKNAPEVE